MPLSSDLTVLLTLFNGQKTDLPDGVVHKDCVFRLNGRAYHETLGRTTSDPLVRLVGCGPAGYRFILAALRHAIQEPEAALHEGSIEEEGPAGGTRVHARGTLSGTLRGTHRAVAAEFGLAARADADGHVIELAATLGDADVELILAARTRRG
jgi:hypothetical protein